MEIILFLLAIILLTYILPDLPRKIGRTIARIKQDLIRGYKEEVEKDDEDN